MILFMGENSLLGFSFVFIFVISLLLVLIQALTLLSSTLYIYEELISKTP